MNHSKRIVVSYKREYVHEVLVNRLFKFAKEKVWWTDQPRHDHDSCCLGRKATNKPMQENLSLMLPSK